MNDDAKPDYRGKRALMFLRVSSPRQEERYGLPAQEKEVREKLIKPLGLVLDEEKNIIRDTHTGLEFRQHDALNAILAMAKRREFDVVVMDVLDRLGRRGLERELYRMQLREYGVRILTTDPNDHADDDSLVGEMVRIIKGYQAEEELNNTRRRSMHGKRVKAEGEEAKGTAPSIIGNSHRMYGYKYVLDDKGKRIGFTLNHDVVRVDTDGTEWTEVAVVLFIFEAAAKGTTLYMVAKALNEKGIPTPYASKAITAKNTGKNPVWQSSTISRIIWNSGYFGEARFFKKVVLKRVPGRKHSPRRKTAPHEQVVVPIPAIVTKELAEAAQATAQRNKKHAARNNSNPEEFLLRAGLVRCGYCNGAMYGNRHQYDNLTTGATKHYTLYSCAKQAALLEQCKGCSILTTTVDDAAWEKAVEIIRNPALVDARANALRSPDPTADRRRHITGKLAEIRRMQKNLEENLATLMKQNKLVQRTADFLTGQLSDLARQEQEYTNTLAQEEDEQAKWQRVQEKLVELHQVCAEMRENLDNPEYSLTYARKRELLEFFGITVIVFRQDHEPRYEVRSDPPSIVPLLSVRGLRRPARPGRGRR